MLPQNIKILMSKKMPSVWVIFLAQFIQVDLIELNQNCARVPIFFSPIDQIFLQEPGYLFIIQHNKQTYEDKIPIEMFKEY